MSDKKYLEAESLKEAMWKNFYKEEDKWESTPEAEFLDVRGGCPRHWFQLGFGVGLDAVVRAVPVPQEMSAGEFVNAAYRMHEHFTNPGHGGCDKCPFAESKYDVLCTWIGLFNQITCEAIVTVEKWAQEHPERRKE